MKIKEFALAQCVDGDLIPLVEELKSIQHKRARVFKTSGHFDGEHAFLVTTSKDVHLALGQLSEMARGVLARFVISELRNSEYSGLIMYMDQAKENAVLATLSKENGRTHIIGLSPAH